MHVIPQSWSHLHILVSVFPPLGLVFVLGFWIAGFLSKNDPQLAVDYGAAHGAFASTTPGDTSMATQKEIEKLMKGGSARVVR